MVQRALHSEPRRKVSGLWWKVVSGPDTDSTANERDGVYLRRRHWPNNNGGLVGVAACEALEKA